MGAVRGCLGVEAVRGPEVAACATEERRKWAAVYRSRKKRMGKMMRRKAAVVTRKLAAGRLTLRR